MYLRVYMERSNFDFVLPFNLFRVPTYAIHSFYLQVGPNNVNVVDGVNTPFTSTRIRYVPGAIRPLYTFVPLLPNRKYGTVLSTRR
jgi:hypothetical protein